MRGCSRHSHECLERASGRPTHASTPTIQPALLAPMVQALELLGDARGPVRRFGRWRAHVALAHVLPRTGALRSRHRPSSSGTTVAVPGPAGGGCRSRASPDTWRVALLETGSTEVRTMHHPLTVVFELHRRDSGGLVRAYATEAAALAFVRDVIRIGGRDQATCFALEVRDERGQTRA